MINQLFRLTWATAISTVILTVGCSGMSGLSGAVVSHESPIEHDFAAPTAMACESDALIVKLAGDDEKARSEARQLLSRKGIEVVPKLVPLVGHEKAEVWSAAFNVLADFANQVGVPGREAERAKVAACIMTLVAPNQPEQVKIRGLRLLPLAVPPGFDVGPVTALLDDVNLREKALAAFEEMGTPEASAALREHLPKAKPDFQATILNSFARLQDMANVQAALAMTKSENAAVRAAALRAIAWTGDPSFLTVARAVVAAADDPTRAEAMDGMLRLIGAIADKGGNWQLAVNAYLEILKTGQGMDRDGAIAGLGQIGDGTCVAPILDAIQEAEPHTWRAGIGALACMQGVDVTRAIVESYARVPRKTQLALLSVLGDKKHALAVPILAQAAQSEEAAFRMAGLKALAAAGLPEGIDLLTAAVQTGSDEEKAVARQGLLAAADWLRAVGRKKEAGTAYLASFNGAAASDNDTRRRAVEGIAACPIADAAEAVKAAATDKALRQAAMRALLSVGSALTEAGRRETALELYETLTQMNPPLEIMREVGKAMAAAGAKVDLQGMLGTITNWWVVGPFELGEENKGWDISYIDEPNVNLSGRYMSGKQRVQWKAVVSEDPNGKIDLRKTVANRDRCIAYAYTEVTVEKPTDALLLVGVDDSERIWLNDEKVFELRQGRALTVDQDRVPVKLKAGTNRILMKIWQDTMGWEFCMRITRPDGSPVSFTQKTE
ncbi:MAG: HEAT repeat domain-containing protein [Phycisphaerae bacterium]